MADPLILVTGGAGFIGAACVTALVARGSRVRVLDDFSRGRQRRLEPLQHQIELIHGDIRDPTTVLDATRGARVVIHLAAINGTRHFYDRPADVLEVGLLGMLHVLAACRAHGVETLCVASSSEVYQTPPQIPTPEQVPFHIPDPWNPRYSYAVSKIATEMLALHRAPGAPTRAVVFRPHNVYGPDMGEDHVIPELIRRARECMQACDRDPVLLPVQGDGSEQRAFIHIDDFTRALLLVLDQGQDGDLFHIGNPEEISIAGLVGLLGQVLGRSLQARPGPPARGGTPRRCPDIAKLAGLGFSPRIPLLEGLRQLAPHHKPAAGS